MAILKPKEYYITFGVFAMIEQIINDLKAAKQDDDPGIQADEIGLVLVHAIRAFFTGTLQEWDTSHISSPDTPPAVGNDDMPRVMWQIELLEKLGVKFPDYIKDKLTAANAIWATIPRAEQIKLIDTAFDSVEGLFLDKPIIKNAFAAARFALGVPDDDSSIGT